MRSIACLVLLLFLTACYGGRVDRDAGSFAQRSPTDQLDKPEQEKSTSPVTILAEGRFVDAKGKVQGVAYYVVQDGQNKLLLRNFYAQRGGYMRIYLSQEKEGTTFVDLGEPQGYSGNYDYALPGTQLPRYILIIDRPDTLYGYAEMK